MRFLAFNSRMSRIRLVLLFQRKIHAYQVGGGKHPCFKSHSSPTTILSLPPPFKTKNLSNTANYWSTASRCNYSEPGQRYWGRKNAPFPLAIFFGKSCVGTLWTGLLIAKLRQEGEEQGGECACIFICVCGAQKKLGEEASPPGKEENQILCTNVCIPGE